MAQNDHKYRLSKTRSFVATALASITGLAVGLPHADQTILHDDGSPETSFSQITGEETTYVAPEEDVVVTFNLGLGGSISEIKGEYAEKFSEDPAATEISDEQIKNTALSLSRIDGLKTVEVRGISSAEDDNPFNGLRQASEKNFLLALTRGRATQQKLQNELNILGSHIQVLLLDPDEIDLTDDQYIALTREVDALNVGLQTEKELAQIISDYVDLYNERSSLFPESLRLTFDSLFKTNRGANVIATYNRSVEGSEVDFGDCITTITHEVIKIPAKPGSNINLPIPFPILIPLLKRRKSKSGVEHETVELTDLDLSQYLTKSKYQSASNSSKYLKKVLNYYQTPVVPGVNVYPEHLKDIPNVNTIKVAEDLITLRRSRGKTSVPFVLIWRIVVDRFTWGLSDELGKKSEASILNKLDKLIKNEINYHEGVVYNDEPSNKISGKTRKVASRIGVAVLCLPIALVSCEVLKSNWYGYEVDDRGCLSENKVLLPDLLQQRVTRTGDACKDMPVPVNGKSSGDGQKTENPTTPEACQEKYPAANKITRDITDGQLTINQR